MDKTKYIVDTPLQISPQIVWRVISASNNRKGEILLTRVQLMLIKKIKEGEIFVFLKKYSELKD